MPTLIELALKYWKYAAAAVAIVALVTFYNVHVDGLEKSYAAAKVAAVDAAYKKGSAEATAAAAAEIARKDKAHQVEITAIKDTYENRIKQNDAAHASDAQRLRQLAAAESEHRANGVLASAGGAGTPADSGDADADGLGSLPARFGLALADALRQDDAALSACYADRDSLTGK